MKVEIENRIENLRRKILTFRKANTSQNPRFHRYPSEIKLEAIALINCGVPVAVLSRAIAIKGWRISEWVKGSSRLEKDSKPAFKELKISEPKIINPEHEARIVTANGISIFIPLSSLTAQLIASIGGLNV